MTYQSDILATAGLVSYWRLNDASSPAVDSKASNNGTQVNGPTFQATGLLLADAANKAVSFASASSQYLSVTAHSSLDLGDVVTIEAWVKRSATGVVHGILSKGTNGYRVRIGSDDKVTFLREDVAVLATSSVTLSSGVVYHVVCTKNGATIKVYVNGVDVTVAGTNSALTNTAYNLYIGAGNNLGSPLEYMNGTLDEVALYSVALSAGTILSHFLSGRTAYMTNSRATSAAISLRKEVLKRTQSRTATFLATLKRTAPSRCTLSRVGTFAVSLARKVVAIRVSPDPFATGAPPPSGLGSRVGNARIIAADTFNRTDSLTTPGNLDSGEQAGFPWIVLSENAGTVFGINSNRLKEISDQGIFPGAGPYNVLNAAVKNVGVHDYTLEVDLIGPGNGHGIVFRFNGETSGVLMDFFVMRGVESFGSLFYLLHRYNNGVRDMTGYHLTGGQLIMLSGPAGAATDHIKIKLSGSRIEIDSQWCRVNGGGDPTALTPSFILTDPTFMLNEWVGLGQNTGHPTIPSLWDNFFVTIDSAGTFTAVVRWVKPKVVRNLLNLMTAPRFLAQLVVGLHTNKRPQSFTRATAATLVRRVTGNRVLTRLGTILAVLARRGTLRRTLSQTKTFTATVAFVQLLTTIRADQLEGRLWVVVKDAAGNILGSGPVFVEALSTVERLDKLGEFAFTLPAENDNASLFAQKRVVELYREGIDVPLFSGIIEDIEWEE